MKKLLYTVLFAVVLLSGCEKNTARTAPASLFLMDGDSTSAGIRIGDNSKAFANAYRDYTIQVAYSEQASNYVIMSMNKIPFDEKISTIIANFFVDGKPVSETQLSKDNNVKLSELHPLLSSPEYLQQHDVVYRYLSFRWENGVIVNIVSDELNYNETFETPRLD